MVTRQQAPIAEQQLTPFSTTLLVGDGDVNYNTSVLVSAIIELNTANTAFSLIWQMTVPAQQVIGWGSGNLRNPRAQGYMHFFALDLTVGFEEGQLRLVVSNARGTRTRVVGEYNTQRLHTTVITTAITATPTDINTMIPLPLDRQAPVAREDSLLQLHFRTSIPTTVVSDCEFSIPATIWQ